MSEYPLYKVPPCPDFLVFLNHIREYGDKTAFRSKNKEWSYKELAEMVYGAASVLTPGKYTLSVENPVLFCAAFLGIVISGGVAVLPSPGKKVSIQDSIELTNEKVSSFPSTVEADIKKQAPNNPCVIAMSSGTTSVSKYVVLSQKNLLSDMVGGMSMYEYPKEAVYFHVLPYFHLFGLVADMLGPLYSGGTICFSDKKLSFFKDLQYFKPTHMNLPPVMADTLAALMKPSPCPEEVCGGRLQKIMCAGAPLSEETRLYLAKHGVKVLSAYGLTECSPCVSMSRDDDYRPGSSGLPLPCCTVTIVDGEIAVRGSNVMLGYLDDLTATGEVIRDGWLYTGDLGYMDEDGFLYITGRKHNLIVFEDGTKLVPEEIESELTGLYGIQECLVERMDINGRIRFKITAYTESGVRINKVMKYLANKKLLSKLDKVVISNDPLPKNQLGKIIRQKAAN